ncbi:MAG: hypothetical protein IJ614_03020 [Prevotella sp.]|nr:hypothetical protein [Prevotella sp.]
MKRGLYSNRPNLTIGFHGCDQSVVDKVIAGKENLLASTNDYDWLGNGIYFWENNEERALEWAVEMSRRNNSTIKRPAVIGAIIDLGYCFDLTDTAYLRELKKTYDAAYNFSQLSGIPLPKNKPLGNSTDLLLRKLDCYVIQMTHKFNREANKRAYDSVRGVFWEGKPLYPNAGFAEKNHIQICVCNPNCIKGYFLPRGIDVSFPNP